MIDRNRRKSLLVLTMLLAGVCCLSAHGGEMLYNGIVLPEAWPPSMKSDPTKPPPYLVNPPDVIRIDVGRQLFVDDFLIESTTLTRTHHRARVHPASPVLAPDRPWEKEGLAPKAAPFSGGVWYDPQDRLFKMWYKAGWYPRPTAYAYSKDGLRWEKPSLDVVDGTNIVRPVDGDRRDGTTAWLDLAEPKPSRRYKLLQIMHHRPGGMADSRCELFFSGDGIHWTKAAAGNTRVSGERTTLFYNPFRKVWVFSIRNNVGGRSRDYHEDPDVVRGLRQYEVKKTPWVGADRLDPQPLGRPCQLYTLDCVAYESLILGLFSIWRGDPGRGERPKWTDVCLGYSRDGFHWSRPDREPLVPLADDRTAWNYGYVQSVGGGCLVVGDTLYFYLSGSAARVRSAEPPGGTGYTGLVGTGYTGLATLRRDGFVSMDAGSTGGTLTTRPVSFQGKHLFVNVAVAQGTLRVEVLDGADHVIAPFSQDHCIPIRADTTLVPVTWKGASDLSVLAGTPVKFRFHLHSGSLYAFWVSPDPSGASYGYVAAGGPGFTNPVDTVGKGGKDWPSYNAGVGPESKSGSGGERRK